MSKRINNKKPTKKLKWKSMEISRVKLNPEQAVLSCCSGEGKAEATGTMTCAYRGGRGCDVSFESWEVAS